MARAGWCVLLSLSGLAVGAAVPARTTPDARAAALTTAAAPICAGTARRVRPGQVSFLFSCGATEDVTGFDIRANRVLHLVVDPSYAFGCYRRSVRSFYCEDIHSGAGEVGSGIATVSEPLCHRGAHLILRISANLNFEASPSYAFTLRGPC